MSIWDVYAITRSLSKSLGAAEEKAAYYLDTYDSAADTVDALRRKLDDYQDWLDAAAASVQQQPQIGFSLQRANDLLTEHKVFNLFIHFKFVSRQRYYMYIIQK